MAKFQINDRSKEYLRGEYIYRINRVIDYIEKNVNKDLSLENLAEVANFSRFHFHRIFRAMVGETLNDPKEHPEGIHIVDICVPVKPL